MMPDIDGFETCARLKANPRTKDAVIIFLSALNEPSEKARGLNLGAVDFINKPFQAEEVLARVRTHLLLQIAHRQMRSHAEEVLARVRTHLTMRDLQQQLRVRNEALEHE